MTGRRRAGSLTALALAGALAGTPVLGACGGGSEVEVSEPPAASATTDGTAAGAADLTIVVRSAGAKPETWHLTCTADGTPGGDHPDPAAACTALTRSGATALPAVGKDRMCTELYGGDDTATITGTWRGETVDAHLNRTNGCEISRWEALVGLLPKAAGAATP